jgi:hypothetical protein
MIILNNPFILSIDDANNIFVNMSQNVPFGTAFMLFHKRAFLRAENCQLFCGASEAEPKI